MIDESVACYRCQGPSTRGMLVDKNELHDVRWVSGIPRRGIAGGFFGEGSGGDRKQYRVVTYHCARCGALESFAIEPL